MSVHSLDWDEVLNKKHAPAAAASLPDSLSDSERSESSVPDAHEPYDPSEPSEHDPEASESEASEPEASESEEPEPEASDQDGSEAEEPELEEFEEPSKPRRLPSLPFDDRDSAASQSSDPELSDPDEYHPHPALTPQEWGDLFVEEDYDYSWGRPRRDDGWLGWTIDPPVATPIWREEKYITDMAEYQILSPLVYQTYDDSKQDPVLVQDVVYYLEEATYYVLGLAHRKKLNRFQTQLLLWKHLVNVYRSLYHLAVETEQYDALVDVLVALSNIRITHPATGKPVQYLEKAYQREPPLLWEDLPLLYKTMLDELRFHSHHVGEGEKAPQETDRRRTNLEQVLIFTAKICSRLSHVQGVEQPFDYTFENHSPYLKAGEFFKAAFGRLQNWSFPERLPDEVYTPPSEPMPRPTEWEIRGAALWMIHAGDYFRQKISQNEQALKIRAAEDKEFLKEYPHGSQEPLRSARERAWFPPWDHGPEAFRYPGSEAWVDAYMTMDFDWDDWAEWTKAGGLNEFRERSWKAWGEGFTAVLDAITKGDNTIFAGGKAMSRSTEGLVRRALETMSEAAEKNKAWEEFEEAVDVISY